MLVAPGQTAISLRRKARPRASPFPRNQIQAAWIP
jgi:hypothetical protein